MNFFKAGFFTALLFAAIVTVTGKAAAAEPSEILDDSVTILEQLLRSHTETIPADLMADAQAVIIFPSMVKGGFFFGARFGRGVAAVRSETTGKWGPPLFLTTLGGSFGLQIGAEGIDLVLLLMTQKGVKGLLKGQFTLGGDISVAAGPVGRHAEAGTDITFKGEIYSYSKTTGAFAGMSLEGAGISFEKDTNKDYYGQDLTPEEILLSGKVKKLPESGQRFVKRLDEIAPPGGVTAAKHKDKKDKVEKKEPEEKKVKETPVTK